jgi:hypothetical protein
MALLVALLLTVDPPQDSRVDGDAAIRYLLSCRRENGAFGPPDRPYTDLAWIDFYLERAASTLLKEMK